MIRKPSRPASPITAVGWNWSSSRSASDAPAAWASSRPNPCEPGGLVVRDHSAAAPPVPSTTARAATHAAVVADQATTAGAGFIEVGGAPSRSVHSARARAPSNTVIAGSAATSAESWRTTRRPVAEPPAWTTRLTECPPSRPSASRAEAVAVEADAERLQIPHPRGRLAHEDLGRRAPDERAPGALGVGEVQLEAVVVGKRRGEAALRPVAGRLGERRGRDQHDPRALARGAERRVEPGGARAHHHDVGLDHRTAWSGAHFFGDSGATRGFELGGASLDLVRAGVVVCFRGGPGLGVGVVRPGAVVAVVGVDRPEAPVLDFAPGEAVVVERAGARRARPGGGRRRRGGHRCGRARSRSASWRAS